MKMILVIRVQHLELFLKMLLPLLRLFQCFLRVTHIELILLLQSARLKHFVFCMLCPSKRDFVFNRQFGQFYLQVPAAVCALGKFGLIIVDEVLELSYRFGLPYARHFNAHFCN